MIIGDGMMACAFERYSNNNDIVIFASGVSNSKMKDRDAFHREEVLLRKTIEENSGKIIVYFSTCSIYDNSVNKTEYVLHKKNMESLVCGLCQNFYIFRLPQVVGKTKSPILVNFLFTSIINNKKIYLNKNSTRNLIDADDVYRIVDYLIKNKFYTNEITNIATPNNDFVLNIVLIIEEITKIKANYSLLELGEKQDIDISKIRSLGVDFNIFHDNYRCRVLYKYFIDSGLALNHMNNIKISIITVVWNNKDTIKDAIDSVLNQTYKNIEYIIIDGASTDGTVETVQSYGDKISKFVSEPDKGLYDAMNKGIRLATGDVVGILNSDDFYIDKHVIERVVRVFHEKNVESIFADLIYIDPKNPDKVTRHYDSSKFHPGKFAYGWMPAHPTFFVKKNIYDKYGLYKTNYRIAADYELLIRFLHKHKVSYCYLPEVLIKMRAGGASTSGIKSNYILNKEIIRACKENGIYTNWAMVLSKYPEKMLGLWRKKDV